MIKRDGTAKLSGSGQVTIPKRIREALHLEKGALLRVIMKGDYIVLIPQKLIGRDQEWFWTEEWQEGEREAEEDIREGRLYGPFDSVEEMKKHFESIKDGLQD